MVKVFDIFSNKGMISYGNDAQVISIAKEPALNTLNEFIKDSQVYRIIYEYFEPTASFLRGETREREPMFDVTGTKQALEEEIRAAF